MIDKFNAQAYCNRGNARMDKGDLSGAIRDFDKAVTLNPQNVLAWNNRGVVRQKAGDLDGALGDFNRAIQLAPRSSRAYNNRGTLRIGMKDFGGAITDYTRAIEIDPHLVMRRRSTIAAMRTMPKGSLTRHAVTSIERLN